MEKQGTEPRRAEPAVRDEIKEALQPLQEELLNVRLGLEMLLARVPLRLVKRRPAEHLLVDVHGQLQLPAARDPRTAKIVSRALHVAEKDVLDALGRLIQDRRVRGWKEGRLTVYEREEPLDRFVLQTLDRLHQQKERLAEQGPLGGVTLNEIRGAAREQFGPQGPARAEAALEALRVAERVNTFEHGAPVVYFSERPQIPNECLVAMGIDDEDEAWHHPPLLE